jgi:hypothetical protein
MKHDILHRHRFLRPTYPSTTDDDSIHPTKIDDNDDVIVQLLRPYYTTTNADPSEPMTTNDHDDGAHMPTLDHVQQSPLYVQTLPPKPDETQADHPPIQCSIKRREIVHPQNDKNGPIFVDMLQQSSARNAEDDDDAGLFHDDDYDHDDPSVSTWTNATKNGKHATFGEKIVIRTLYPSYYPKVILIIHKNRHKNKTRHR